jgi:ankyrin repeat protein
MGPANVARVWGLLLSVASLVCAADPPMIEAVKSGDVRRIRMLLASGADPNFAAPDGATPLHWAAYLDRLEVAALLLEAGAQPDTPNRYGVTPLLIACETASAPLVELLLRAGAAPNRASPEGETPLMLASRAGNLGAVKALLGRGADVNAREGWRGQTALMWAAAEGHTPVVEALLAAGADLKARSRAGFTALLFAVREGRLETVNALLKAGADPNEVLPPQARRRTGADPIEAAAGKGTSALHLAVANAHFELAAALLDAGADPNADGPGWTPLHVITWVRKPGYGSNDPAPPGSGKLSSLDLVRKLAEKGANLNARMTRRTSAGLSALNMRGATAFLMAARTGDAELMRLLAQLGADPLLPNEDNSTPLMVAAGLGTRSPGEDAGTEEECLEAVKVALELGNDINAVDNNGETAMHGAAYKHLPAVVRLLAARGAKVEVWNRKNRHGWTPLRIAAGVHRTGNFRSSPETAAAIREVMAAAGVPAALEADPAAKTAQ